MGKKKDESKGLKVDTSSPKKTKKVKSGDNPLNGSTNWRLIVIFVSLAVFGLVRFKSRSRGAHSVT